jgi:hypothetical protein
MFAFCWSAGQPPAKALVATKTEAAAAPANVTSFMDISSAWRRG